jgi:hypothetical protein
MLVLQLMENGLVLWVSWIDDCVSVRKKKGIDITKKAFMERFDCDDLGNMDEYVGCKLVQNHEERWIKFLQPVLLQSYKDKFALPDEKKPVIPADGGPEKQKMLRSGTGKLLHMMQWSRPEILNSVRELSRKMQVASEAHLKAMCKTMRYCLPTPTRRLLLKPTRTWDGSPEFEFIIKGQFDANYAMDTSNRRTVSGFSVFLEEAPVAMKSVGQRSVTLSTAEAKLSAATACAQEMLYVMRILESIGLRVK